MLPGSRSLPKRAPYLWILLAWTMALMFTGCGQKALKPTVVPSCPPAILAEPNRPERPGVLLWYKIEEGKEFFIMDRGGYLSVRDYVLRLEGAVDFSIDEIRESNERQTNRK